MAEAMVAELIMEAEWILKNYWTKARFPFKTVGGWSDIDVLAYSPSRRHLVISESKAEGPKNKVYAYTPDSPDYFISRSYLSFLDNLPIILKEDFISDCFAQSVKRITVQLVSNTVILPSLLDEAQESVVRYVKEKYGVSTDVMLDSSLDVLARVVCREREREQGRRYGHPVIDIAREINRYLAPSVARAGRGKAKTDPVKRQGLRLFWEAIGGQELATFLEEQD